MWGRSIFPNLNCPNEDEICDNQRDIKEENQELPLKHIVDVLSGPRRYTYRPSHPTRCDDDCCQNKVAIRRKKVGHMPYLSEACRLQANLSNRDREHHADEFMPQFRIGVLG